jgi:L-threonylcarbamoyladenylate synthase
MTVLRLDPERPDPALIAQAAQLLRRGGLVAFPTETVYGLGAHALDEVTVRRVFEAKGRPSFNPLIVHTADVGTARGLVASWPAAAERLTREFWPGPLTLVLPKQPVVPDLVTAGLPSVAVRVPANPIALALLRAAGLPIAAPSANRYTEVSPTTAEHVAKSLGPQVDLILDGGPTRVGIESTVLDLTGEAPRLLRPGSISAAAIEELIGPLATGGVAPDPAAPRASPGMARRHYAPRAELRLFARRDRAQAAALARQWKATGRKVGALLLSPLDAPVDHPLPMPADPDSYANRLYAALHELDDRRCDLILVERVPDAPAWAGVLDRLVRAAE